MALGDVINLALKPFGLAIARDGGLALKGTVDEVRRAAARRKRYPISEVEIIGLSEPENPDCSFLGSLTALRSVRIFAAPLTGLEILQELKSLRSVTISHVAKTQKIAVDFAALPVLERLDVEWFNGAESLLHASGLRRLTIDGCPFSDARSCAQLKEVERFRLSNAALLYAAGLESLPKLRWLAVLRARKLCNFSVLAACPSLQFLWIEGCPNFETFRCVEGAPKLETIRILDCGHIDALQALGKAPRLRHIHVSGRVDVAAADFSFLRALPHLENVEIKNMPKDEAYYWAKRNHPYQLLREDLSPLS